MPRTKTGASWRCWITPTCLIGMTGQGCVRPGETSSEMSNRIHSNSSDILEKLTMGERPTKVDEDEPALHRAFCAPLIG